MKPKLLPVDPNNPESIVDQLDEDTTILDGRVEFGEPLDPNDAESGVLAGGTGAGAHNGTLGNIWGSWVEVEFIALDTAVVCNHNLYLDDPDYVVPAAGEPNVRWFVVGWQHSGATRTLYEDLRVPMAAAKAAAKTPLFDAIGVAPFDTLHLWWFSANGAPNEEELFFTVQLPHAYKEGTDIEPHVHWTPEDNAAANECVKWGLEYSWANRGSTFPASTTIYTDATDDTTQTIQGVQLVAGDHYVSEFAAIDGSEPKTISSMLACRLFRNSDDASDDYDDEAGLLEFDFHIELDGYGSDGEHSKTSDVELEWNPFNIMYNTKDSGNLTENSIELRAYAGPGLKVDGTDKLKVTLFFIRATQ